MTESGYLIQAKAGLADMTRGLSATMGAAAVVAKDGDLPTDVVSPLREAVRAVEFAMKKVAVAASSVEVARKIIGAQSAD
jgi:hypothetical protein